MLEVVEGTLDHRQCGHGDTQPVTADDTPANKAKNRRIEFRIKKRQTAD